MRYPLIALLTALAVLFGSFISISLYPPPELKIEGQAWCYVADYQSMKEMSATSPLTDTLVDVHSKGVTIYEKCNGN